MLKFLVPLAAFALTACNSQLSADLTVSGTTGLDHAKFRIKSVQLQKSGGGTETVDSKAGKKDLLDYSDGSVLKIFSDKKISAAHYTGIALVLEDSDSSVTPTDGDDVPVSSSTTTAFIPIDFTLKNKDQETVHVNLDLRFSLSDQGTTFDFASAGFATGHGRSQVTGSIDKSLLQNDGCQVDGKPTGASVYVFDENATPDDFHSGMSDTDRPIASAAVTGSDDDGYAFQFAALPHGDDRFALTCDADDPQQDEDITFLATQKASINASLEIVNLD